MADIQRLRCEYKAQVLQELKQEMSNMDDIQLNRNLLLKKFIRVQNQQSLPAKCDPADQICLYDFTIKQKCPNYFSFRVQAPLTDFLLDDYFPLLAEIPSEISPLHSDFSMVLIERNRHLCSGLFEQRFRELLTDETSLLYDNKKFSELFDCEVSQERAKDYFVEEVTRPLYTCQDSDDSNQEEQAQNSFEVEKYNDGPKLHQSCHQYYHNLDNSMIKPGGLKSGHAQVSVSMTQRPPTVLEQLDLTPLQMVVRLNIIGAVGSKDEGAGRNTELVTSRESSRLTE